MEFAQSNTKPINIKKKRTISSNEDLEEQGWEQFHLKILRQDLDIYLQGDKQLGEFQQKIDYTKQKVDYLENIIKQLNGRGYLIKNAIDFMRFQTGA